MYCKLCRKGQGPRLYNKENIQQLFAAQNIRMSNLLIINLLIFNVLILLIQEFHSFGGEVECPKIFLWAQLSWAICKLLHRAIMIYTKFLNLRFFTTRELEVLSGFFCLPFFLTKLSDFLHMGHTSIANSLTIEYMSLSLKNHRIGQCYRNCMRHDLRMLSQLELVFPVARITSYFLYVNLGTLSKWPVLLGIFQEFLIAVSR